MNDCNLRKKWSSVVRWAKNNLLKWTAIIAVLVFVFGPFAQGAITSFLQSVLNPKSIDIFYCNPIKSSLLVVSSSDGKNKKIHSVNTMPFIQVVRIAIINNLEKTVPESSAFVAAFNANKNYISHVRFYTDSNISKNFYKVEEVEENGFNLQLGKFFDGQILVMEFVVFHPTNFLVEFGGLNASKKSIVNAGDCDFSNVPDSVNFPVDFFSRSKERDKSDPDWEVDNIINPAGPLDWEVILNYNCGKGLEQAAIPLGGSISFCGVQIN